MNYFRVPTTTLLPVDDIRLGVVRAQRLSIGWPNTCTEMIDSDRSHAIREL